MKKSRHVERAHMIERQGYARVGKGRGKGRQAQDLNKRFAGTYVGRFKFLRVSRSNYIMGYNSDYYVTESQIKDVERH